jgi:sulfite reductase alpha subunit
MHCINVMTGALARHRQGRHHPDRRQAHPQDRRPDGHRGRALHEAEDRRGLRALVELAQKVIDFFAENALEHERTGEMIERIGLVNFLEGIGLEIDPTWSPRPAPTPTSAPTAGTTRWQDQRQEAGQGRLTAGADTWHG